MIKDPIIVELNSYTCKQRKNSMGRFQYHTNVNKLSSLFLYFYSLYIFKFQVHLDEKYSSELWARDVALIHERAPGPIPPYFSISD
jgi:hypothetical protein